MQYRPLGRTGIDVSEIGFGCGSVGGLMIRGDYSEMVRAVAWAVDHGITYFDTARSYGNGQSETHLGRVLKELKPDVVVGTKISLGAEDLQRIEEAVAEQIEGCLGRLGRESVDVIYLHNQIVRARKGSAMSPQDVAVAAGALQRAQDQGKTRCWGLNGLGDTDAIHEAVAATHPFVIQSCYNMLNPSSGVPAPQNFPFQNYRCLMDLAHNRGIGVAAIRVLAAGALSGRADRHPVAMPEVGPIGSGRDYSADVARAQVFSFLVEEGIAETLVEAAIRFALSQKKISTALVGLASYEQLEAAVVYGNRGSLPVEVLDRLETEWARWGHR
ncbi:MAG: aldo/keto reductase [bacterium]|nr:aldo/keto reductase [bacterium]